MMLTKRDIEFIQVTLAGEMLCYESHAAMGHLKPGRETEHLAYLRGLSDRLDAALTAAPPEEP